MIWNCSFHPLKLYLEYLNGDKTLVHPSTQRSIYKRITFRYFSVTSFKMRRHAPNFKSVLPTPLRKAINVKLLVPLGGIYLIKGVLVPRAIDLDFHSWMPRVIMKSYCVEESMATLEPPAPELLWLVILLSRLPWEIPNPKKMKSFTGNHLIPTRDKFRDSERHRLRSPCHNLCEAIV